MISLKDSRQKDNLNMYVCVCNTVTDSQIHQAISQGVQNMDDLKRCLKVATCCGRCSECANKILTQALCDQACSVQHCAN